MTSVGDHPLTRLVAKNLKRLIREKGINDETLAKRIGTDLKEIRALMSGGRVMSAAYLYLCAHHLGVPLESFYEGLDPTCLQGTRVLIRAAAAV
jgi:transcriptional regulator with XRE-family HTH domain